jgi:hypothetical protein
MRTKYVNIIKLVEIMKSYSKHERQNCEEVHDLNSWYLSLTNLENDEEFTEIIYELVNFDDIEENFHKFFTRIKLNSI